MTRKTLRSVMVAQASQLVGIPHHIDRGDPLCGGVEKERVRQNVIFENEQRRLAVELCDFETTPSGRLAHCDQDPSHTTAPGQRASRRQHFPTAITHRDDIRREGADELL